MSKKPCIEKSVFRSAVTNADGDVDAGYLAVFWALVGWSVNNGVILALAWVAISKLTVTADAGPLIQNVGIALGANATGFGVVCAAVGVFRAGDRTKEKTP